MYPPIADVFEVVGPTRLLEGQTVMVTGAAGGIGRVLTHVLAVAGARLAITDVDDPALTKVATDLSALSEVRSEVFDATDADRFAAFSERVAKTYGSIDGLVNCTGLWASAPFEELDSSAWEMVVTANVTTTFVACHAVAPAMVRQGRGSIVNFASTAGEYGSITPAAHYAASKGAVIALTKSLARELSPYNVRVNALSPGPIDTPSLTGGATSQQRAAIGARTLFGRMGEPHEVAGACAFLLSPLATFITGHVLRVNGGSLL